MRKNNRLFRFCRMLYRLCTRPFTICSVENTPPSVYIIHHQNLKGPLTIMGWFDKPVLPWVLSPFCQRKPCFRQYYDYTLTKRFRFSKPLAAISAFLLSFFVPALMKSMGAIPVFRGSKAILQTFYLSIRTLLKGETLLICPDIAYTDTNPNIGEMYNGFLHLEKYYFRKTGRHLPFIPLHIDPETNCIYEGNGVCFTTKNFHQEKPGVYERIKQEFSRLESS